MRVSAVHDDLSSPSSPGWKDIPHSTVKLAPVPLDAQPNAYVRAAWADRAYGRIGEASVAAARNGSKLFVHLEWSGSDPAGSNGRRREFTDAAAVYFPVPDGVGDPESPTTIGSRESPVSLWLWREPPVVQASMPPARSLVASGPGVFRPFSDEEPGDQRVEADARREGPRWSLVISGESGSNADPGLMGIAVWDGSNDERAGIGAATPEWITLEAG